MTARLVAIQRQHHSLDCCRCCQRPRSCSLLSLWSTRRETCMDVLGSGMWAQDLFVELMVAFGREFAGLSRGLHSANRTAGCCVCPPSTCQPWCGWHGSGDWWVLERCRMFCQLGCSAGCQGCFHRRHPSLYWCPDNRLPLTVGGSPGWIQRSQRCLGTNEGWVGVQVSLLCLLALF